LGLFALLLALSDWVRLHGVVGGEVVVVEVGLWVVLLPRLHLASIALFAEREIEVVALEANPVLALSASP
jgi:hypothetical protein